MSLISVHTCESGSQIERILEASQTKINKLKLLLNLIDGFQTLFVEDKKLARDIVHELIAEQEKLHSEDDEWIVRIYAAYPRKADRPNACKAIAKALSGGVDPEFLLERTVAYSKAVASSKLDMKFVPHAATWFNGERYNDNPKEWTRGAEQPKSSGPADSKWDDTDSAIRIKINR